LLYLPLPWLWARTGPPACSASSWYRGCPESISSRNFQPLFPITSTVPPDPDFGGPYCLELRSVSETLLDQRCFNLTFTDVETGKAITAEGFSLALPYPDGTQAVILTRNGIELGRVSASPSAPQISLITPNGGEIWQPTGTYTVTWTASDADGGTLHYAVPSVLTAALLGIP